MVKHGERVWQARYLMLCCFHFHLIDSMKFPPTLPDFLLALLSFSHVCMINNLPSCASSSYTRDRHTLSVEKNIIPTKTKTSKNHHGIIISWEYFTNKQNEI